MSSIPFKVWAKNPDGKAQRICAWATVNGLPPALRRLRVRPADDGLWELDPAVAEWSDKRPNDGPRSADTIKEVLDELHKELRASKKTPKPSLAPSLPPLIALEAATLRRRLAEKMQAVKTAGDLVDGGAGVVRGLEEALKIVDELAPR